MYPSFIIKEDKILLNWKLPPYAKDLWLAIVESGYVPTEPDSDTLIQSADFSFFLKRVYNGDRWNAFKEIYINKSHPRLSVFGPKEMELSDEQPMIEFKMSDIYALMKEVAEYFKWNTVLTP